MTMSVMIRMTIDEDDKEEENGDDDDDDEILKGSTPAPLSQVLAA